ncbi:MAG TPA: response regulator [Acidobacteriota bacterium]|nr:response regulator [Acidobacteriota bacterium]
MRILVVDDDFVGREKLKAILAPYGDVDAVPDGEIAVRMVETAHRDGAPYHLATMDVNLPGLSGAGAVAQIRVIEKAKGIAEGCGTKVLMISARADSGAVLSSFRFGCEGYLVKPATPDNVGAALEKMGIARV